MTSSIVQSTVSISLTLSFISFHLSFATSMLSTISSLVMPVCALITLICVLTAGSSLISACTFAPCDAKPCMPPTRLTQNAVLPDSGLANNITKLPAPIPGTCSCRLGKLNSNLVCISKLSISSPMSSVTASSSCVSVCVPSSKSLISLNDLSCPLNISVATTATLCARFLLCTAVKISAATSSLGSCSFLISSTIDSKFTLAALVNAGLYFSKCKSINSSIDRSC